MKKILSFIENHTRGKCYKSFKYCLESVEVPTIVYDDKQYIIFENDKTGETDKGIKESRSIHELAKKISKESKPLFKYFLDGSRRTYKVDDIAYDNRLYPIIAGQIGVGCCERPLYNSFKSLNLEKQLVLSLPDCADKDDKKELFFNSLLQKLNEQSYIKKHGVFFHQILNYSDRELKLGEKYEHRGIATIQDQMIETEKTLLMKLVKERKLNFESYLLKDGSLEYQKMKKGNYRDLSAIKSNYRCVVGASKSFNPELCKDQDLRSYYHMVLALSGTGGTIPPVTM
jgi:hypothetical protein